MCVVLHRTPAFFSFVLAPGQRVWSIDGTRVQCENLQEYQNLDVGNVGQRVTYLVDTRIEYPVDDGSDKEETEEQREKREDQEWEEMIDCGKPAMLTFVRQVAVNGHQSKLIQTFREKNAAFFLSGSSRRGGPDIVPFKKPIIPTKPPRKNPPRPKPKVTPPPPSPKPLETLTRPPKKEAPPKKKQRAPPPKREYPPKRIPAPPPLKKEAPPAPTPKNGGIGMKISEKMFVTGFAPNGAAAECGRIKVGDKLLSVDDHDVTHDVTMDQCSQFILGPLGSEINLKFSRSSQQAPKSARSNKSGEPTPRGAQTARDPETKESDKLEPELFDVMLFRGGLSGKKAFDAELQAHEELVKKFEDANAQALFAYQKKLEEDEAAYKNACKRIDEENRMADAAYFKSLEDEDEEYQKLVKKVEEENRQAEEAYEKLVKDQEAAYKKSIEEEDAAYKRRLLEDEEENRLALAWWKYGGEIDPPQKV
jgi:hypothetical protein